MRLLPASSPLAHPTLLAAHHTSHLLGGPLRMSMSGQDQLRTPGEGLWGLMSLGQELQLTHLMGRELKTHGAPRFLGRLSLLAGNLSLQHIIQCSLFLGRLAALLERTAEGGTNLCPAVLALGVVVTLIAFCAVCVYRVGLGARNHACVGAEPPTRSRLFRCPKFCSYKDKTIACLSPFETDGDGLYLLRAVAAPAG